MINFSIIQLIISVISFFYILNSTLRFFRREKRHSFLKFITTVIVWLAILLISVFPKIFKYILSLLGLSGDINFIIFAGFIIVFILIFRLLSIIEGLERNITEIIRKEALKKLNEKI